MNGTQKTIPKFTVALPEWLDAEIRLYAVKNRLTLTDLAKQVFEEFLAKKAFEESESDCGF
jgi:hypothetical protein